NLGNEALDRVYRVVFESGLARGVVALYLQIEGFPIKDKPGFVGGILEAWKKRTKVSFYDDMRDIKSIKIEKDQATAIVSRALRGEDLAKVKFRKGRDGWKMSLPARIKN